MVGEVSEPGDKLRAFSIGTPHADTGVREIRELIGSGKAFAVLTPISLIPQKQEAVMKATWMKPLRKK